MGWCLNFIIRFFCLILEKPNYPSNTNAVVTAAGLDRRGFGLLLSLANRGTAVVLLMQSLSSVFSEKVCAIRTSEFS
jgi:hypothetical protein